MTVASPYRISLAVIARDEARCIVRCLDSVRDVVDEMVVVDTGSVDDTVGLAEAAGATVHHFTWIDDFSAAKNAAIGHCTGDWVLVLDADEWLASGAEALERFRSTKPTFSVLLDVASYAEGMVHLTQQARLLPASARYSGRVHEQPELIGRLQFVPVRIEHDGYEEEQRLKKVGRNRRLLEQALLEDPLNAYLWFQIGSDHETTGDRAAAVVGFERAYQLTGSTSADPRLWSHQFIVHYIVDLVMLKRTQEAIDLAFAEYEQWQGSADFQFVLGHALLQHGVAHPELRDDVFPLAEQAWQTALSLGDSHYTGSIEGRGGYLAATELVRLYELLGREEDAERMRPLAVKPA